METGTETHKGNGTTANGAKPRSRRGFAGMDRAAVRELASKGGKAAHVLGTAHEFTPDEARAAGRKGGLASHKPRDPKA
jgi:general stress protein YciG